MGTVGPTKCFRRKHFRRARVKFTLAAERVGGRRAFKVPTGAAASRAFKKLKPRDLGNSNFEICTFPSTVTNVPPSLGTLVGRYGLIGTVVTYLPPFALGKNKYFGQKQKLYHIPNGHCENANYDRYSKLLLRKFEVRTDIDTR
jgi:hypothetical protein